MSFQLESTTAPNAAARSEIIRLESELGRNPYCDVMRHKSTQINHFFKDAANGAIVNKYQKPLGLYLQLLKMFAYPNTLVLNVTAGTGSLEIAALETAAPIGLKFVSFERNAYQSTQMQMRLTKSCIQPTSQDDVMVDVTMETMKQ